MPELPEGLTVSGAIGDPLAGECFEFLELFDVSLSLDAPWEVIGLPERVYTPYFRKKIKRRAIRPSPQTSVKVKFIRTNCIINAI